MLIFKYALIPQKIIKNGNSHAVSVHQTQTVHSTVLGSMLLFNQRTYDAV